MEDSAALAPGLVLEGKYRVRVPLGSGAMGVVYEADHLLLQKPVAVKVLRPELAAMHDLRDRFEAEARAAAALGHPNVVTVTDMGRTPEGALYFVMDLLRGESLGERLARQGRLPVADVAAIAIDVLAGLEAAHELGLVHRDLKPDNVFLARVPGGRSLAKILDFGVAKALAAVGKRAHGTRSGLTVGTPLYMAPEQALAQPDIDGRADLYALGVIMFQALAGRPPFDAADAMGVITAALTGPPPQLGPLCPDAPPGLVALVEAALSRDRGRRPATAGEFAERLRAAVAGTVAATPSGGFAPVAPPSGGFAPIPATDIPRARLTNPVLVDLAGDPVPARAETSPAARTDSAFRPPRSGDGAIELARQPAPPPPPEPERPRGRSPKVLALAAAAVLLPALVWGAASAWPRVRTPARELIARAVVPAAAPAAPAAPAREMVLIGVEVTPEDSRLFLDGQPLTSNPVRLGKGEVHTFSAVADGHQLAEKRLFVEGPTTITLRLKRARR